jgi:hypothetical protein
LKYKKKLRKLYADTRDPVCKTAVNWVTGYIRRIFRKITFERLETRLADFEVAPQAT